MSADHSELVVALVAAVGTDVGMVGDHIASELTTYDYKSELLRLSDYLNEQAEVGFRGLPFDEEVWEAMTEGDRLRQRWERDDALALHAISDIVATREELSEDEVETCPGETEPANLERHAFILRSLKTPDELETLRAVYGPRLVVVGAYSPKDKRLEHLADQIERSRRNPDRTTWVHQPEELIDRDEKEEAVGGQDLSGTFHRADFFIRAWDADVIRADVERTLAILFGDPFRTPTRDEYGQFQAAGAALRSAELGRQVGAAIATDDGSVIALGANEVPRFKGGSHWDDDPGPGNRDFEIGDRDTNRAHLDDLAEDLTSAVSVTLDQLISEAAAQAPGAEDALAALRDALVAALPSALRAGGLKDLTEFGRAVHAEMDALLDATRRGINIAGGTLYTTTFPCHNCARHIIGAGIQRVVFIEPYAKSRAESLHEDSIVIAHSPTGERLRFEPFVGVAPRRYLEMFDAGWRTRLGHVPRAQNGIKQELDKKTALPVFVDAGLAQFRPELPGYRAKELLALDHFNKLTAEPDADEGETSKEPSDAASTPQQEPRVGEEAGHGEPESTDSSDSEGQH
jgi:deoxycytidylate deaminase